MVVESGTGSQTQIRKVEPEPEEIDAGHSLKTLWGRPLPTLSQWGLTNSHYADRGTIASMISKR